MIPPGRQPVPPPAGEDATPLVAIDVCRGSEPGQWVVAVAGEIDVATSPELREAILGVIDEARVMTFDLGGTTFIDSSGLGVLVGALKRSRELGHDGVTLRGLQEPVRRVFEITGLTQLFAVED